MHNQKIKPSQWILLVHQEEPSAEINDEAHQGHLPALLKHISFDLFEWTQGESLRNLDTQTTIAFGHGTSSLDLMVTTCMDTDPDCLLPLGKHIFGTEPRSYPKDKDQLCVDALNWVAHRGMKETPSFEEIDPILGSTARMCYNDMVNRDKLLQQLQLEESVVEVKIQKFQDAVKIMTEKQVQVFRKKGYEDPTKVDLFNVKMQNLEVWIQDKIDNASIKLKDLKEKFNTVNEVLDMKFDDLVRCAYKHLQEAALAADTGLMQELEAICPCDDMEVEALGPAGQDVSAEPERSTEMVASSEMHTHDDATKVTDNTVVKPAAMESSMAEVMADESEEVAEAPEVANQVSTQEASEKVIQKTDEPPNELKETKEAPGQDGQPMVSLLPHEHALRHVKEMEDGPVKSALMNLCESMMIKETLVRSIKHIWTYMFVLRIYVMQCTHALNFQWLSCRSLQNP